MSKAKSWLKVSKAVVISGYGFDESNNKHLDLRESLKNVHGIVLGVYKCSKKIKTIASGLAPYCGEGGARMSRVTHCDYNGSPWNLVCDSSIYDILAHEVSLKDLYE